MVGVSNTHYLFNGKVKKATEENRKWIKFGYKFLGLTLDYTFDEKSQVLTHIRVKDLVGS